MNPEEFDKSFHELIIEQTRVNEQLKTLFRLMEEQKDLTNSVKELALSLRDLTNAQKNTAEEVKQLRTDLDEIQRKPAKRLDVMQTAIISSIVSGLIGFVLAQLFM